MSDEVITWLTVCGTAETPGAPGNTLTQAAGILGSKVEHHDVVYPASIAVFNPTGNISGVSEATSRAEGVAALAAAVRATPNRVVVSGYSLGALVVSDFLAAKQAGEYSDCEISAVVQLANPARQRGVSYGRPSTGFGLDGEHSAWPDLPVYEIANPLDPITSAPADSPWRQVADLIREFNISVEGAQQFFDSMIGYITQRKTLQARQNFNWVSAEFWVSYLDAPAQLRAYLFDGEHTSAYQTPGWFSESGGAVTGIELVAEAVAKYV